MSTAHRPTWHNAIAQGLDCYSKTSIVSSKDLPAHKELKRRAPLELEVEGSKSQKVNEQKRLLKEKLESSESEHKAKALIEEHVGVTKNFLSLEDATKLLNQDINAFPEDEDDEVEDGKGGDTEDEEMMLLRELEKIKKEKEEIRLKEQQEEFESEENRQRILSNNPLLNSNFNNNKRWDEDVIFKNPARETKDKPQFINDVVRSEFHKRFLQKYIG